MTLRLFVLLQKSLSAILCKKYIQAKSASLIARVIYQKCGHDKIFPLLKVYTPNIPAQNNLGNAQDYILLYVFTFFILKRIFKEQKNLLHSASLVACTRGKKGVIFLTAHQSKSCLHNCASINQHSLIKSKPPQQDRKSRVKLNRTNKSCFVQAALVIL